VWKLLIFAGMAAATYLTRFALIAALGMSHTADEPSMLHRWLRYVPPAVLAALIMPPILAPEDRLTVGPRFLAGCVSAGIAWHTRSVFWTILGGLVAFWLLRALGGQ
jgi:branched-subunit amino acid transport protein